jgi:adenylate kinase family enzyme
MPGQRIAVVGTTGSGKTTTATRLAAVLGCRHVELDALHWEPNWVEAPLDVFRQRVKRALAGDAWVVDGNYSEVRDIVWGRADTVVWLDFALPVILLRLVRRTIRRVATREELWNGNRERFWAQFLSRESLFLYALKTYRSRRRTYAALGRQPAYGHLEMIRLRSPREAEEWLRMTSESTGGTVNRHQRETA